MVEQHQSAEDNRRGYDGEDRRSWRDEATVLHGRLASIESLAKETQMLARATHDSVLTHVAEDREAKAAISELILLWRGSKMMVAALKFSVPVIAALIGAALWARDHFRL